MGYKDGRNACYGQSNTCLWIEGNCRTDADCSFVNSDTPYLLENNQCDKLNFSTDPGADAGSWVWCACMYLPPTAVPSTSPSTTAPSTIPSTTVPTFSPSVTPSTISPTVSTSLTPSEIKLPKCPEGWTLHCTCQWTLPQKTKDVLSLDAVAVDEVSSSDGNDRLLLGILVGSIGIVSLQFCIWVLYFWTRSGKGIILQSEYIPINGEESG